MQALTENQSSRLQREDDLESGRQQIRTTHTSRELPLQAAYPLGLEPDALIQLRRLARVRRVLIVATEWQSVNGGISTLSRHIARNLVLAGMQVYYLVPSFSMAEFNNATECGVRLIAARPAPRITGIERLSHSRPGLPKGTNIDIVIGHGWFTGAAAREITERYFPESRLVHFVHETPDTEWEKAKYRDGDVAERAEKFAMDATAMAYNSSLVAAVGPRVMKWAVRQMSIYRDAPVLIQFDPGFSTDNYAIRKPPPGRMLVSVTGRPVHLKGIDIAAQALGRLIQLGVIDASDLELLVRGVSPGTGRSMRRAIQEWAQVPSLTVTPRVYAVDESVVKLDISLSTLALMPSREEGFGLVGQEAITAGTPVLISRQSGLGDLLTEILPRHLSRQIVIPLSGDIAKDIQL